MAQRSIILNKIHFKHLDKADFELLNANLREYIEPNDIKMIVIDSFVTLTLDFIDEESGEVDHISKAEFIKEY